MDFLDLPDAAKQHFPSHGWLAGVTGMRSIKLPVLRLFQPGHPSFSRFSDNGLAGMWLQANSPYRTLRQLGIALRDLHSVIRFVLPTLDESWNDRPPSSERDRAFTAQHEAWGRIEILLIAIFVLLRRLAEELIVASRPILFEHWHCAPKEMKTAIRWAREGKLSSAGPLCNVEVLENALLTQTGWLASLREDDGIRDILIHRQHILQVSAQGVKAPGDDKCRWRVTAHLVLDSARSKRRVDLLPALSTCLEGVCAFMSSLYRCVGPIDGYCRDDALTLTGMDNDIVGFWPAITGEPHQVPLMD